MMKRGLLATCLAALMLLAMAGCDTLDGLLGNGDSTTSGDTTGAGGTTAAGDDDTTGSVEDRATRFEAETTFHNSFLGVSYTVPSGWWQYYVNEENFSTNASVTGDLAALDTYSEDGYIFIDLGKFASLQYSTKDSHLGIGMYAEQMEGYESIGDFTQYYVDFMVEPVEGEEPYELMNASQMEIGGIQFEAREFRIPQEGGDYSLLGLVCALDNGYFLTIEVDFWPDNATAKASIPTVLEKALSIS